VKILYIENHAVFSKQVCQEFLSAHQIRVVSSLTDARSAMASETYDLLLVDYDLDDGKGDELVREVRVLNPKLKIIAASSHEAGNAALVKAGASAVCGKMEFDKIAQVIKRLEIGSAH
jgi:DNA-binding NarL/FixJ family response regulator